MVISAKLVKELRERTGLGMMECKKALVAVSGDIEQAIEELRKSGQSQAAKKASRTAAEGVVTAQIAEDGKTAVIVEINSETDFVARDDNFKNFASRVVEQSLTQRQVDMPVLMQGDLEQARLALVQKIGENIHARRGALLEAETVGAYVHTNNRIGVLVGLKGGNAELAKDIAMHIAAVNPQVVNKTDMPAELIEKEKEIFKAQAVQSGKPEDIVEKMVVGRVKKFLAENSLTEQAFVKDPEVTVGQLAQKSDAVVESFVRFEVGEGIEKEEVDFAAEVAAQAGLSS